ncbi:MAG: sigma-70 family RNA polymerase sigma factor [Pirellulaceae bacterium]|nr:sigma-70 family RNA polymerase sigma factor [Pirellulaceae bacterium]
MNSIDQPDNDQRTKQFLTLLGRHERRLRGFILSLAPNWADADDIAQEVRIRLWEQFDAYDPEKDFGAWARTIAYYQVLTHREKQSRHRIVFSDRLIETVAEETAYLSDELDFGQKAFQDCFDKLPEAKRDLLLRYYSGELTTRELAAELGRSFDATRQSILRTRVTLRDCVEETLEREGGR